MLLFTNVLYIPPLHGILTKVKYFKNNKYIYKYNHFCLKLDKTRHIRFNQLTAYLSAKGLVSTSEKCPNTEFFWSLFSRIWTEYGYLRSKSGKFQSKFGKIRIRKNSVFGHLSRSAEYKYYSIRI